VIGLRQSTLTTCNAWHSYPRGSAIRAGLEPSEVDGLAAIDRDGLELAARSFEKKRTAREPHHSA